MNNEIHDYSFDNNTQQAKVNGKVYNPSTTSSTSLSFIGKVFLTMFIGLLITTAVSVGTGYLFAGLLNIYKDTPTENTIITGFLAAVIVSGIGLLIMSFVLPIMFVRGKHNILVPGIIYTVLMGILLSIEVIFTDPEILLLALGITTAIFGLMALIGFLGKGRMTGLGIAIIGLFAGLVILSIINIVITLLNPDTSMTLYWIISLGFFAVIMLITIWDMRQIKLIAERGEGQGNNVVLYCAFIIYTDFISILIRLIYYLGIASKK